jgi:hypothetical protein
MTVEIDIAGANAGNTPEIDTANAAVLEDLLVYLALCEPHSRREPTGRDFDGAYLYGSLSGVIRPDIPGNSIRRYASRLTRWEGKLVHPRTTNMMDHEPGLACILYRLREAEGWATAFRAASLRSPILGPCKGLLIDAHKVYESGRIAHWLRIPFFRKSGRVYVDEGIPSTFRDLALRVLNTAVCHMHLIDTRWSVLIRPGPDTPSVGLFTDATGVKELLKFRGLDPGKSRRDALLHWVSQHWRQDRHDPDVEVYVREHLRGSTRCPWHGMEARIVIPAEERERLEAGKRERKRLSAAQLDRRLRAGRHK